VSSSSRHPQSISVLWLIPAVLVSLALGAYFAITLVTANLAGWGLWLRDFAQSPGAAAFAALVAASIAFVSISRQVSVSRDAVVHQREAARADAWWAMFEWASNRAIPLRKDDQPLPTSVTIRTLQRLAEDASSNVQEAACAGVIDVLTKSVDSIGTESFQDHPTVVPSEHDDSAFEALASYVESSRGTPAASVIAEALIYENSVLRSLMSVSEKNSRIKVFRNPGSAAAPDIRADAIAEVDGQRVVIHIKFSRNTESHHGMRLEAISSLRVRGDNTDRYLLITPLPSPLNPSQESELRTVSVQWQSSNDTSSLESALCRASTMP
jgi:hypothetical protein